MIVVVDANVRVSALEFGGTPSLALTRVLKVDRLAISGFIEAEVVRVVVGKFGREKAALQKTLNELLQTAFHGGSADAIRGACRDPNDEAILETGLLSSPWAFKGWLGLPPASQSYNVKHDAGHPAL